MPTLHNAILDDDYIAAIRDAANGEIRGEAMFNTMLQITDVEHQHKLQALAALEKRTGEEMQSLVRRYGLEMKSSNVEDARAFAKKYEGMGWTAILEQWTEWIPPYVELYDRLAARARPADRDALAFLAAHEHALDDFIRLELSGDSEKALSKIQALLRS